MALQALCISEKRSLVALIVATANSSMTNKKKALPVPVLYQMHFASHWNLQNVQSIQRPQRGCQTATCLQLTNHLENN